jgi:hypothetical protein
MSREMEDASAKTIIEKKKELPQARIKLVTVWL